MNLAKSSGIISEKEYPFGRRKYIIPVGRNIKRTLDAEHIEKIFNYETDPFTSMDQAKDFWIFSYLCNGINNMDIAHLRWSNIQQDKIVFERSKTKRTKRDNPVKIIALRNPDIDRIIKKWGTKPNALKDIFVFEIIDNADNAKRAREKVQLFTHVMNDWLKEIGKDLKLPIKLTTYTARHSFATMLVRGGAPLAFASQTLGHSNILTTAERTRLYRMAIGNNQSHLSHLYKIWRITEEGLPMPFAQNGPYMAFLIQKKLLNL